MIFFSNAQGTITEIVSTPVHQGSSNANEVIFVGPFKENSVVTVSFILPNGVYTEPSLMTLKELTGIEDGNGNAFNAWTYLVPGAMTEFSGVVTAQFTVTNGTAVLATASSSFNVLKGVPNATPDPEESIYQQILSQLSEINLDISDLESGKLDKQTMSSGQYRAYVVTPDGNQGTIGIIDGSVSSAEQLANNIARYDSFGRLATSTPTENQHATSKQYVDDADENLSNEIETLRQDIDSKSHFRGYLTTAEIQSLLNPDNGDYAWSSDTLTVWSYNGSAWVNTGNPVPDQTVPKGDSIPLPDAATGSAGSSTSYAGIDHVHPLSDLYESASTANAKWQAQGQVNETIFNTIEDVSTSLAGVIGEALSDIPLSPEQTGAAIMGENTLAGASVSVEVRSKNLFNIGAWDGTSIQTMGYIRNAITLSDGVFTNPISQYNDFYSPNIQIPVKKGKVTVSADVQCPEEGFLRFSFGFCGPTETTVSREYKYITAEDTEWHNYQITVDVEKDGICYFACANSTVTTGENYTVNFRNVQVELGETATPYTPYVAEGTETEITACGKNLFTTAYKLYSQSGVYTANGTNGFTWTSSESNVVAVVEFTFTPKAGRYTISFNATCVNSPDTSLRPNEFLAFEDGQVIGIYQMGGNQTAQSHSYTFTKKTDESSLRLSFYASVYSASLSNYSMTIENIQLEIGETVTEYTVYEGNTYPVTVGGSVEIVQYDKITNVFTDNAGVTVSAAFKQSTRYELDDRLVPLFGAFASRPTDIQPYARLYVATDQTDDNKVTILPANTDGSVSENWITI